MWSTVRLLSVYSFLTAPASVAAALQNYTLVPSRKACSDVAALEKDPYCQLLAKAKSSDEMGTGDLAAKLYDAYHAKGGGELLNKKPRPEQMVAVSMVEALYSTATYPTLFEGGPGSCWALRTFQTRGYKVHAQEISQLAIQNNCKNLDVRQGYLKNTSFETNLADVAVAFDVMEHVPSPDLPFVLTEIGRIVRPRGRFLFSVGICAKWCTGFCSSPAIHPTGICDDFPRSWWDEQIVAAGYKVGSDEEYGMLAASLRKSNVPGHFPREKCNAKRHPKEQIVWCETRWNPRAHNYFIVVMPEET